MNRWFLATLALIACVGLGLSACLNWDCVPFIMMRGSMR